MRMARSWMSRAELPTVVAINLRTSGHVGPTGRPSCWNRRGPSNDNDIRVHETEAQADETAKTAAGTIVVRNEKELAKAAGEWPASRLVELWNSFAGVAPFTDCKPLKKFTSREKAV